MKPQAQVVQAKAQRAQTNSQLGFRPEDIAQAQATD